MAHRLTRRLSQDGSVIYYTIPAYESKLIWDVCTVGRKIYAKWGILGKLTHFHMTQLLILAFTLCIFRKKKSYVALKGLS